MGLIWNAKPQGSFSTEKNHTVKKAQNKQKPKQPNHFWYYKITTPTSARPQTDGVLTFHVSPTYLSRTITHH